jgi:hypothetical protein
MSPTPPPNPEYDEFAAAFGDASARGPIDYRRIEVVDPEMAAVYRAKTIEQRLDIVNSAHRMARDLIEMGIRYNDPKIQTEELQHEVARRLLSGAT